MDRRGKFRSSAVLSAVVLSLLVWVFLTPFVLAPQAAPVAEVEPPPERMTRGLAGGPESLLHLAATGDASGVAPPRAPAALFSLSNLVFQSYRDGNWEIYRADGDGSNQTRLTHDSRSDVQPRLNRGCARIAFSRYQGDNSEIYTMNADGSGQARLTSDEKRDGNPAWSWDSSRIAFASYRTGGGDIYVMNADGGGQTRLTSDAAWEGEPAWSPDGTQIAFTSYHNSVYRIWRMNADGSGQVQLSTQPYSEHAAWSPDGSQIAFDADANGDGWQELWLMNADGTNEHPVYDPPEGSTDAWMGSWSPDGRYLAFTRISWIYYQGAWYWTTAYLDAWDSLTGSAVRLSSQGEDLFPDWQTTDALPPVSSMAALPHESPSPITVHWSGADNGPAGLQSFDVQVRDGGSGVWTDWLVGTLETSAKYPGLGGHSYAFRCRARDYAGNVETWPAAPDASTQVEALPPRTAVNPLPPYVRGEAAVAWAGSDPGGSGIASYDVQVRDGPAGAWLDWQMGTLETSGSYSGQPGHTYFFRSRGVDLAQNVEAWPAGEGDSSTTFYLWRVRGTLRDNRETPVMGGILDLIPTALALLPSNLEGAYAGYEAAASEVYTATWEKAGYGQLPPTALSGSSDAHVDIVLPPVDNAVPNWDFETGSLEPEWLAQGDFLPVLTSTLPHTGRFSAAIGHPTELFNPWVNLSNSASTVCGPAIAVDGGGAVHAAWWEVPGSYHSDLFYARREPGGDWSAPLKLYETNVGYPDAPQIAVEAGGVVHLAWVGVPSNWEVLYSRRSPDGTWSGPISLYNGFPRALVMALGVDGAVHLAWSTTADILYTRRAPDGTWSTVANVSQTGGWSEYPQVAAGPDGTVHAVWADNTGGSYHILYAERSGDGSWSSPLSLGNCPYWMAVASLGVAVDGSVHVAWLADTDGNLAVQYARRAVDGAWADPVHVADNTAPGSGSPKLALGLDGSVHLVWGGVVYARQSADGVWSAPEVVDEGDYYRLRVDSTGAAHIIWSKGPNAGEDLYYARRTADGNWCSPTNVSSTSSTYSVDPQLALDAHGGVHAVWRDGTLEGMDVLYVETALAGQTGDSILSQELTVPPLALVPTLSFWYALDGTPTPGGAWFDVHVQDGLTNTPVLTATRGSGWTHGWVDLSPWADQAVSLRFRVHQTEGLPPVWGRLDEVSVGLAYPDVWVRTAGQAEMVSPDEPVAYALWYGNRGGVPARGVVLTDTLPGGLDFVSADPPPSTVAPYLTWQVGDLPARSGPFEITLTAMAEPGAPMAATLTNTVLIGTSSPELETLNNEAKGSVWVGWRILLPTILRNW